MTDLEKELFKRIKRIIKKRNVVILLSGISGSGKTTLAERIKELRSECRIVSGDLVRAKFNDYNNSVLNNKEIYNERLKLLDNMIKSNIKLIVIDDLNLISPERRSLVSRIPSDYYIMGINMISALDVAIINNKVRSDEGGEYIPQYLINQQYNYYEKITKREVHWVLDIPTKVSKRRELSKCIKW